MLLKGARLVYVLLSLEMMILGALMFNMSVLGELNYILSLIFAVSSRVVGLVMLIQMMVRYGSDHVKM